MLLDAMRELSSRLQILTKRRVIDFARNTTCACR